MAKRSNIEKFLALSDAEKLDEVERAVDAPGRPMSPAQQDRWAKFQARAKANRDEKRRGRPKVGAGAKVIALSVEAGLLKRADAYAKANGLKRAELVAKGLELALKS